MKTFTIKKVFFSGNIQDSFPAFLSTSYTKIHFQKYDHYLFFKKHKNINHVKIYNKLLVNEDMVSECDTVIYYWPKDKHEAAFQLTNILSCVNVKTTFFIVGENRSGIKSVFLMLSQWMKFEKIDSAKHCILIKGQIKKQMFFILEDFFRTHVWKKFFIKVLPGVFGYKKIDEGSQLLASTFSNNIHGKILDLGCGSGFLSISLLYRSQNLDVTLVDRNISALISAQKTLEINKLTGKIILSDLYSNIFTKFNLIISNPPFHNDLKIDFNILKSIIHDSIKYLKNKGELRFVTSTRFHYDNLLKKVFKRHVILKKTNRYKVYQAFVN